jgi:EamA domain-containing membrane protein RarD
MMAAQHPQSFEGLTLSILSVLLWGLISTYVSHLEEKPSGGRISMPEWSAKPLVESYVIMAR